jgi:PAS domain S-box-containing protein
MPIPIRVLVVHGDPGMIVFMRESLRHSDFAPEFTQVDNEIDYRARLGTGLDVILACESQTPFNVGRALKVAQECAPDMPFIVVAGSIGEDRAVEMIKEGAWDYVHQDRLHRLGQATQRALDEREHCEQKRIEDERLRESEARQRGLNAELEEYLYERTAELYRQQMLLQTILDSMGEGLLFVEDLTIRYTNRTLAELTGYQVPELIGRSILMLKSDQGAEASARALSGSMVRPGATWRGEVSIQRKNGTPFDSALTIRLVTPNKGEVAGLVIIVRDITVEKRLQEQKMRFIANASHELRTPLTNINTRLYLLRKQPEDFEKHMLVLERAATRMIELTDDLLDMTRFERGVVRLRRELVSLGHLIADVVRSQQWDADQKGIELVMDMPEQPLYAFVDARRMMQVFTNLVVNAINYTADNGHVTVQLRDEDDPGQGQHYALIRVFDNGIGIAAEYLEQIFEPFFRASEGSGRGTGLGLSIAREVVELHGGLLTAESTPGTGSVFSVRLKIDKSAL